MLSRFKMNVQRFPRTFVVLCVAIVAVIADDYAYSHAQIPALYVLGLLAAAFTGSVYAYKWFISDSRRVGLVLSLLNNIEGHDTDCSTPGCEECEINEEESEEEEVEGCGDPACESCYPKTDLINDERGQDIAEYAVMLAVMLVIVIGTIRLIGSSAGNVFSSIGSQIGNAQ
jgi:Flp pilus assembly pilin Flp